MGDSKISLGQQESGFECREIRELPEYDASASWWVHGATGCELVHLHCSDPENMCAFAFPTAPTDSTGVAHILEHTVLCGSERFPLKDPFLRMLQGSVYTFLNAFTFPDKTVYPLASVVEKDYFNLMKVYGDAVFFPLLEPAMFRQEGHRLVLDDNGKLGISGVVYNEMLGAFSSQEQIESRLCLNGLFPDTPYGFESGGDPQDIPKLTYDEFVAFHREHYHPGNARIFLYGNIPAPEQLAFLQEHFLSRFEKGTLVPAIPMQPRWQAPRRLVQRVPGEEEAANSASVTLNWLLFPAVDMEKCLSMEILSEILLGTDGSPLQRLLLESGLGEDLSGSSGYESEIKETVFSVGLRGTAADAEQEVEKCVEDALKKIIADGLEADLVEGTLRRFEFRLRELGSGGNVGLHLMRRAYQGWMHGAAPWDTLAIADVFKRVRDRISKDSSFLTGFIQEYLLDNPHRLTVSIVPDAAKADEDMASMAQRIAQIEESLTEADRQRIIQDEKDLHAFQQAPDSAEAEASLPKLCREDVPRDIRRINQQVFDLRDGVMCYYSEQACRGIVYCNIAFEVGDVGGEAEMLLPLLASAITGLGTSDIPYHLMSHQIGLVFGGLRTDLEVADHAETQNPHAVIWMKSRFLVQYADEALPLLDQLLCQANFADHTRLREIMLEMRNDYRASIVQNGSAYAGLRAEAGLSTLEEKEERLKGISQYQYLDAVLAQPVEKVAAALEKLRDGVIRSCRSEVQLTCDPEHRRSMQDKLPALMVNLWSRDYTDIPSLSVVSDFKLLPLPSVDQPESLVTTTSVNYLAMAFPGALVFQPGFAAQSLISHLLSTGYLWERCRMRGGAYGASAGVHGLSGIFRFITYRDPQTARTLEAFFESFDFMSKQMPSDDLIETGIIALVGKELRPMNPGAKGLLAYRRHRFGITDDLRQENRDRLLALGQEDLRAELQLLNSAMQRGVLSMLVSPQALSEYGQAAELQANESQAAAQDSQQPSVEWLLRRAAVNQHVVVSA